MCKSCNSELEKMVKSKPKTLEDDKRAAANHLHRFETALFLKYYSEGYYRENENNETLSFGKILVLCSANCYNATGTNLVII